MLYIIRNDFLVVDTYNILTRSERLLFKIFGEIIDFFLGEPPATQAHHGAPRDGGRRAVRSSAAAHLRCGDTRPCVSTGGASASIALAARASRCASWRII